jgi:hypothetical protein
MAVVLEGCDYSYQPPTVAELRAAGMRFVCRYLSHTPAKNLTRPEADRLTAAGLGIVVVWQQGATQALAGAAGGRADAAAAQTQLLAVGGPADAVIYFAVDFDTTTTSQRALADSYLDAAAVTLGGGHRVGVYGEADVLDYCWAHPNPRPAYGWQTRSWSAGRWSAHAVLQQYAHNLPLGSGWIDRNRALAADYGQWGGQALTVAQDAKLDRLLAGAQALL